MPVEQLQDQEQLVHLMTEGSEYAFTQIFDHYRGPVFGTALKYLKSEQQAEEIVQDIFLKVWTKRVEMREVKNFSAFLFTMARNAIIDRLRKMAKERVAQEVLSKQKNFVEDADYKLRDGEYQELLEQAISNLTPKQKEVFILAKMEGCSYREIAEKLDISVFTVKVHMTKSLQSIREYLQTRMDTMCFVPLLLVVFGDSL